MGVDELEGHGSVGADERAGRGGVGVDELVELLGRLGDGVGRGVEAGEVGLCGSGAAGPVPGGASGGRCRWRGVFRTGVGGEGGGAREVEQEVIVRYCYLSRGVARVQE